jgi:hypothetical protein
MYPLKDSIYIEPLEREREEESHVCPGCYSEIKDLRKAAQDSPNVEKQCKNCKEYYDLDEIDEKNICTNCAHDICDGCGNLIGYTNLHMTHLGNMCNSCLMDINMQVPKETKHKCKGCKSAYVTLENGYCRNCYDTYCRDCGDYSISLNANLICFNCSYVQTMEGDPSIDINSFSKDFYEDDKARNSIYKKQCSQCLQPFSTNDNTQHRCDTCINLSNRVQRKYNIMTERDYIPCTDCGMMTPKGINELCVSCSKKI